MALLGLPTSKSSSNAVNKQQWSIPDSDCDEETVVRPNCLVVTKETSGSITNKMVVNKFNLPSDSEEEEDPYSMAKSPSLSIKSVVPPVPPPVSTIPRHYTTQTGIGFLMFAKYLCMANNKYNDKKWSKNKQHLRIGVSKEFDISAKY